MPKAVAEPLKFDLSLTGVNGSIGWGGSQRDRAVPFPDAGTIKITLELRFRLPHNVAFGLPSYPMNDDSKRRADERSSNGRNSDSALPSKSWRYSATLTLRLGITFAVILGVGRRLWLEKEKLRGYELDLIPGWLVVSGACYLAGLATAAMFWRLAIQDRGGHPDRLRTLFAYYAGHLGKYVPGKALVVVIRARIAKGPQVTAVAAAMACVHETVLTMAIGASVSFIILLTVSIPHRLFWLVVSGALTAGLVLLALPPVVSWLGKFTLRLFPTSVAKDEYACRWQSVRQGSVLIASGWFLLGLSLLTELAAMHSLSSIAIKLGLVKTIGLATALVALASVGGFVSLTPGGLGTREWILVETLGPLIGTTQGVVAAVLLRIVWVISEVIATGTFWLADNVWSSKNSLT